MKEQIEKIKGAGRFRLANILERIGPMRLKEYSASLWEHEPEVDMEPELECALEEEFENNLWPESVIERALSDLKENRVLQTATHLTVSEGPTFLAVHHMATAALPSKVPYLVGAFSGVPFSNPAWSGCLNFSKRFEIRDVMADGAKDLNSLEKDEANRMRDGVIDSRRISLVPSKMQKSLVFKASVPQRMHDLVEQLRPSLADLVPEHDDRFCEFALSFSQSLTRKALRRKQMWYFNLNEVILAYLIDVLPRADHPIHRLLFDHELRNSFESALGEPLTWFYAMLGEGNHRRFSKLCARGDKLVYNTEETPLVPDEIIPLVELGFMCPGVFLTFAVLSFLNGFRCLGSFEQVRYLEKYRQALSKVGWPAPGALDRVDTAALSTGRCVGDDGLPVYPLDVFLGLKWKPNPRERVWDLVEPLVPRLLGQARP